MKGDADQEETTGYNRQKGEDKQTPSGLKRAPRVQDYIQNHLECSEC